ncbi:hypothetical protein ACHZ97_14850 [Lysobacter soli]|uniref:hypothetical protein n=1 Tax=Lysobacter soli TaxID=453783 RepID=UPI0037CC6216
MQAITKDVRLALDAKLWRAALALALTIPDVCARLQGEKGRSAYVRWFDAHVGDRYRRPIGPQQREYIFMDGRDAYALRCAYLHQQSLDTDEQEIKHVVDKFKLTISPAGFPIHLNGGDPLQVDVRILCEDICAGADAWAEQHAGDKAMQERMQGLASFLDLGSGPFSI